MTSVIYSGLASGAVYALIAIGYNLVFLPTGVFNFAHAQLVVLSTLLAYTALETWEVGLVGALLIVPAAVATVSLAIERVAVRPALRHDSHVHTWLVVTIGVAFVVEGVSRRVWGSDPYRVELPGDRAFTLWGGSFTLAMLLVIGAAVVIGGLLELVQHRTLVGSVFRATAEDRGAAEVRGVNTARVGAMAWAVGGAIAALSGLVMAPLTFASVDIGPILIVKGFLAMAIGGFGSIRGSLIGGAFVGLVEALTGYFLGVEYRNSILFLVLLVVLLLAPAGVYGQRAAREV